jgi:hypothetical protein
VVAAISFTSSDDVFVASSVPLRQSASSRAKITFLSSMLSNTASTATSAPATRSKSSVGSMRARRASASAADRLPLVTLPE